MTTNPLLNLFEQAGAEFQAYDQIQIVSTFGEPEAEYAAIRKSAAIIDQPQRGFLELTGADRLSFLNNFFTQQVYDKAKKSGLAAGEGAYGFVLQRNGRILADANVIEGGDRTLLEIDARLSASLKAALDKYIFSEKVQIADRSDALHQIAIYGPKAREVIAADLPELTQLGSAKIELFGVSATVWRDDIPGVPGYHLVLNAADAKKVWEELLARHGQSAALGRRDLRPAGWAAFNATRIENGRPLFGIDFDESVLPHETGQTARAVSFTKGCYLGQEIVARMHARGAFARQLVGIRMTDDALPIAGATIYDDKDNQVGGITSSTISPVLSNAAIAIGFVKKQFVTPGSVLRIPAEGSIREGKVVETPFVN
jgi:folate-binding protein YgfZ